MNFEFATASRILFGCGVSQDIPALARTLGTRAFLVTGKSTERVAPIINQLLGVPTFSITGEPTVPGILAGVAAARDSRADLVIAVGGGSALDAGKAIAALLTNEGDIFDYLEVVGKGSPLVNPAVPVIAVPTTAGAGAEVTRNAVILSPEHRVKASMRSPSMLPRMAVVDPELTYELPPALTAATGLDALTQLIEPYVSTRSNPMTDGLCLEGITRAVSALPRAFEDGRNAEARQDMALASLFGGLALANAGLGAVHGFAAPIGGMFSAPHGAVCAVLLPHVMAANLQAGASQARYTTVARLLTGNAHATADDGIKQVDQLTRSMRIPPLSSYGITTSDIPSLVDKAQQSSSMKANPVTLPPPVLAGILRAAL